MCDAAAKAPELFYCVLRRDNTRALLSMSREPLPERRGVGVIVVGLPGTLGGRRIHIVLCRFGTCRGELGQDWLRRCGRRQQPAEAFRTDVVALLLEGRHVGEVG